MTQRNAGEKPLPPPSRLVREDKHVPKPGPWPEPPHHDFEAAMRTHYPIWSFASDGCGGYHNERTELAWQGWRACYLHMTQQHAHGVQQPDGAKR